MSFLRMLVICLMAVVALGQFALEMTVTEGCPPNTLLGNLNFFSPPSAMSNHLVPDPSIYNVNSHSTTFQLLTRTSLFRLNSSSGKLYTQSSIDRESICPQKADIHTQTNMGHNLIEPRDQTYDSRSDSKSSTDAICRVKLQVLKFTPDNDQSLSQHHVLLLDIVIFDVNDNAPSWPDEVIHLQIPEHCPIGTRLPIPTAFDPDCGLMNTTVSYSLEPVKEGKKDSSEANDAFQLDTEIVANGPNAADISQQLWSPSGNMPVMCTRRKFKLWLRITRDLDYDKVTSSTQSFNTQRSYQTDSIYLRQFQFQLIAVDGGHPVALTGTVLINISVTDINDHAPQFRTQKQFNMNTDRKEELLELEENAPVGHIIYTARSTDIDAVDQKNLEYSIDSSANNLIRKMFEVNSKSGDVILLKSPDYEVQKSFSLPLIVSDGKHQATLNLVITIKNLNDHAPKIAIQPIDQSNKWKESQPISSIKHHFMQARTVTLYLTEHEPAGRFIATVTVSDEDESTTGEFSAAPSTFGINYLHMSSGLESATIRCQLSHSGLVLRPLFEGAINQFKLVTGTIFDREQQKEHFTTLTCFDRGTPSLSSQIGLHLIILDINDHAPRFKHSQMIAYLKEKEPAGAHVYTVEATDADVGLNSQLGFSLTDQNNIDFTIDPSSGLVTSLREFDYEQQNQYNLTVIVRDQYEPISDNRSTLPQSTAVLNQQNIKQTSHSIKAKLIIYIQDVNDCSPLFGNSLYQLSVPEDAKVNHLIGQIKANDSDGTDANSQIHYLIKHQSDEQPVYQFRVSSNGYIFVARSNLDREKQSSYTFFLVAIDSGTPPLSSSTQVHIYVTDVNDNAPTWVYPAHNNHIINMTINEPVGYRLAQLNAIDPDESENGEVVYRLVQLTKILSTNEDFDAPVADRPKKVDSHIQMRANHADQFRHATVGNLFEIDPTSGSIYVGRSMSRDDVGSIKLIIEASDQGKPPKINHRVLHINILHFLPHSFLHDASVDSTIGSNMGENRHRLSEKLNGGKPIENDLLVIVIMVAITLIISLALIVAILFLRCGICPSNRSFFHYNAGLQNDYRRDLTQSHQHHHLEEVFRDSSVSHDHLDEVYNSSGMEHVGTCKQFTEGGGYQLNDGEMMYRSFLSSPGSTDPWMASTPKKNGAIDSVKLNHLGGTLVRVQTPTEYGKRSSLLAATLLRTKQCEHGNSYAVTASTQSPEHEVKQIVLARQTGPSPNNCSTFRASCSHSGQQRTNTLCNILNKCDDVDSMDSGHGRSCSTTENALMLANATQDTNTFCKGMNNCTPIKDPVYIREKLSKPATRPRSGTLPSLLNEECMTESLLSAKSTTDLCSAKRQQQNNHHAPTDKSRQSVTWLVENDYHHMCGQSQHITCLSDPHSANQVIESTEPTLVLIDPSVDPLGYAQLLRPKRDPIDCPSSHACDSFPTSFV